ncbi:hypothetical protein ACHAW6_008574 [Cyclotella cf. meneghiniana]
MATDSLLASHSRVRENSLTREVPPGMIGGENMFFNHEPRIPSHKGPQKYEFIDLMSTSSSVTSTSSEEEFNPPPPPPPRILLLRGKCLGHVLSFLDAEDKANAMASCRLFREASSSLDDDSNKSHVRKITKAFPPDKRHVDQAILKPSPKLSSNKFTITAPPGRLGIRLENSPSKRGTVVALVLEASPLQGKICGGDMIVGVNGVDVSGMDTYGVLDVCQRNLNEERLITVVRFGVPSGNTVNKVDETPSATNVSYASNDHEAQHEICTSIASASAQQAESGRGCRNSKQNEEADATMTGLDSIQSKSILRTTTTEAAAITPLFSLPYHGAPYVRTMPFGMPRTVPSSDSDLQLESLDLNSLNSCKSDHVSSYKRLAPFFPEQRPSDGIPFDELEVGNVKLPEFPPSSDHDYFVPLPWTPPGTEVDDDDLTMSSSASSTYVSSLSIDQADVDHDEEKADYLAQFADVALFGDTTLFTSFVREIIDSAKDAARLVVSENGDPIDDQGPIKIGDNYYTHREAIQKWKSARDKLENSKYKYDDVKLQQKLENAAMKAATLMAATKTLDLAARRSGRNMEKKEQKSASKKFSGTDRWEREELEQIYSREKEKEAKIAKDKNGGAALTIHQLVNQFPFFGFASLDAETKEAQHDPLDKITDQERCQTPVKSIFPFLEDPSPKEFTIDVQKHYPTKNMAIKEEAKEAQDQYFKMNSDEDDDVGIELGSSNEVVEKKLLVFSKHQPQSSDTDTEELELDMTEQLELTAALRAPSPSTSVRSRSLINVSPSTPISYASSVTEVAGCGGKNRTLRHLSVASSKSACSTSSGSDMSEVEQSDSGYIINGANTEQYPSTASSTKDSRSDTSEEPYDFVSLGVETKSFVSGDHSGKVSKIAHSSTFAGCDHSASQASALDDLPKPKTAKQSEDDGARVVVDEVSGVLLSASGSGAIPKVTYDSLIGKCQCFCSQHAMIKCSPLRECLCLGSQYGTEVILSDPKLNEPVSNLSPSNASKEPLRKVSARKPRSLVNRSRGIVTPSPTKTSITLRRSGADMRSSPLTKRINPLKLIKAPSSKKQNDLHDFNSEALPTKEASGLTSMSVQVTPKGDACPKPSLNVKMSFGITRSRSAVP